MSRTRLGKCAALLNVALLCVAGAARAADPLPAPTKATPKPATIKAAPTNVAPVKVAPQVVPRGDAKPAEQKPQPEPVRPKLTPPKDTLKTEPQPGAARAKTKKSLIAPAGLLSQAPSVAPNSSPGLGKLDLNRATLEQLQRLPGVGITWAPRILAGRPYRTPGDLARDGIPYTTIDALSREVEFGP